MMMLRRCVPGLSVIADLQPQRDLTAHYRCGGGGAAARCGPAYFPQPSPRISFKRTEGLL